jgi:hypothetical protein
MLSAIDKRYWFRKMKQQLIHEAEEHQQEIDVHHSQQSAFIIYVGDSSNDILTILDANLGILLSPKESTEDFCRTFGITIHHLDQLNMKSLLQNRKESNSLQLWKADSWKQIEEKVIEQILHSRQST